MGRTTFFFMTRLTGNLFVAGSVLSQLQLARASSAPLMISLLEIRMPYTPQLLTTITSST